MNRLRIVLAALVLAPSQISSLSSSEITSGISALAGTKKRPSSVELHEPCVVSGRVEPDAEQVVTLDAVKHSPYAEKVTPQTCQEEFGAGNRIALEIVNAANIGLE